MPFTSPVGPTIPISDSPVEVFHHFVPDTFLQEIVAQAITRWCSYRTQTSRLLLFTTAAEATALFVQQHVKCAIILNHVTPPHGKKMAAIADVCERTATVALPTAASPGFISGELGISAALDAFSTVYELPLTRFNKCVFKRLKVSRHSLV